MYGSEQLVKAIRERIGRSADQAIRFRDYMQMCLYEPECGYYSSDRVKIGRSGDFYTSASIGGLIGETLADYIASQTAVRDAGGAATITEWGGGNGRLARQLLDRLEAAYPDFYAGITYISIEKSPVHLAMQQEELSGHRDRVRWMTEQEWLNGAPWNGAFIISNELVDAMPVHRIQALQGRLMELYVEWDEGRDRFAEKPLREAEKPVADYLAAQGAVLREGQLAEVNLDGSRWIAEAGSALGSGQIITIDYGDAAEELYAPHRMKGTFLCYRRHAASDDPYAAPGETDMTAHVNFTALIEAGERSGLRLKEYKTQKQFLVDNGILHKLQNTLNPDPFSPEAKRNRAIRQLLLSDQMSELFKVLVQEKR
ncbi:hypothetical protein SK3146_06326 [Paenibacillus konkukensis]|uniref:SAM-dependent methyltransferase n=1 Tax=Paenibacillus konkukensis TaxID=2020716 RepID=A0ABY4RXU3_9BACL|nr:SAM-dependent methyltransferase [Paenibacillus konkukensis]UQZ87033.1 hypothetical protein SK3146_06326 [Paenibacillus konkukensis]